MIVLSLRTDKPEAQLGLYDNGRVVQNISWEAHRQLGATVHKKLDELLNKSSKSLKDIDGIVIFKGPGSFTGLRIGLSVANALAYALQKPIVAAGGQDWLELGLKELAAGKNDKISLPEYGAPAATTHPRK